MFIRRKFNLMELSIKNIIIFLSVIFLLITQKSLSEIFDSSMENNSNRLSGYYFLSNETRELQDDEFLNPGMFSIEKGREIWFRIEGKNNLSCASCHNNAEETMIGVAAQYPKFDEDKGSIINLELLINKMRNKYMNAEPYKYESDEMLSLTAFITFQSRGYPIKVSINGPSSKFFDAGPTNID